MKNSAVTFASGIKNKWHGFVPALLAAALFMMLPFSATAAVCPPSSLTTLTNGSPADANQVMDNFNYILGCPNFTGNVGVGVPTPLGKVHVRADVAGNDSVPLVLSNHGAGVNTAAGIFLDPNGNGHTRAASVRSRQSSAGTFANLEFWTANGAAPYPAMYITPARNVGIGTSSPGYLLDVQGTAYAVGAAGALSDMRHKKNIEPLKDGALDIVMQLRPVSYLWKDPRDDGMKGKQMGFIAQDVEKLLPTTVLTEKDAEKTKGLKYNEFISVLTKAVQEQQHEIASLKAAVAKIDPKAAQTEKEVGATTDTASAPANPLTPTLWALLGMAVGVIVTYAALRKRG